MSDSNCSRNDSPSPQRKPPATATKKAPQTPQQKIDEFWAKYKTKAPGKATHIIPKNELTERAARRASAKCKAPAKTTEQSYEAAAEQCRRKVAQIVKECRRVNQKYRDPHFDLEIDLKLHRRDCLDSLDNECDQPRGSGGRGHRAPRRRNRPFKDREDDDDVVPGVVAAAAAAGGSGFLGLLAAVEKERAVPPSDGDADRMFHPQAVARVVDIFDKPQFFIDGPTANDVRQGRDGDCWLMAALCTLSNKPGLIERLCVAYDVDVGVYGFVFHRDGEWFSEIIDDKLYLTKPDYDESLFERILWNDRERGMSSEEEYKKVYQSNSGALYFAQCEDPNETWLPLLEKAYAKAHGDYSAIEGGFGGEGLEDLTGGVTSEIYTTDILDKEHFWKEELMKVNQDFLFGCSTGVFGLGWGERKGIVELHAYSVLKAREIDGVRLVLLKNPWGKHEWTGAWSDGSKEWTGEWLQKLDHKFGDDGSFWISYEDLLKKYQAFDRTRLFGPEWKVASIWTTLEVPWTLEYLDTKFAFSLSHSGPVVIVFAQLDERYFKGLEGQYRFELSFRVHKAGNAEDYVVRSQNYYRMNRSVNVELDLEAGEYVVVVRIDAQRNDGLMPVEDVVRANAKDRREKLLRIGLAYDVAHSKGKIVETAQEKEAREAFQKRKRERERKHMAKMLRDNKLAARKATLREKWKERQVREKAEARSKARAERKAAKKEAKKKEDEKEIKKKGSEEDSNGKEGLEMSDDGKGSKTEDAAKDEVKGEKLQQTKNTKSGEKQTSSEAEDKENAPVQPPANEKNAKLQVPAGNGAQAEGSTTSTEPAIHTPTSSTVSGRPFDDDGQDEDYVTAAEDDADSRPAAAPTTEPAQNEDHQPAETPKTSRAAAHPPKDAQSVPERVDVGVQTGPGLPLPPLPPPPPMSSRRRGGGSFRAVYSPPPPPPGYLPSTPRGARGQTGPPLPPHLQGLYMRGPPRQLIESTPLGSDLSESDTSDSELESDSDDVSEISEHDIDMYIAESRARAMRAAAAQAAKTAGGSPGQPVPVEVLDEFEKDPWNAVGVFGLRVYYRVPEGAAKDDEMVRLWVERPNPYVWDESSDEDGDDGDDEKEDGEGKGGKEKEESKVLDVDDSAKDAVGEQPPTPSSDELVERGLGGGKKEGQDSTAHESVDNDAEQKLLTSSGEASALESAHADGAEKDGAKPRKAAMEDNTQAEPDVKEEGKGDLAQIAA